MVPKYHNCTKFGVKITMSPDPPKKFVNNPSWPVSSTVEPAPQNLITVTQSTMQNCSFQCLEMSRWVHDGLSIFLWSSSWETFKSYSLTCSVAQLIVSPNSADSCDSHMGWAAKQLTRSKGHSWVTHLWFRHHVQLLISMSRDEQMNNFKSHLWVTHELHANYSMHHANYSM